MFTRRQVLTGGAAAAAGLVVVPRTGLPGSLAAGTQTLLAGTSIPQFADPLPAVDVIHAATDTIELQMRGFQAQVLPAGSPKTWVWGYLQPGQTTRASYPGPVIVAQRGTPTQIKWVNDLGTTDGSGVLAWASSTDQTLGPARTAVGLPTHLRYAPCAPGDEAGAGAAQDYPWSWIAHHARGPPSCRVCRACPPTALIRAAL